MSKLLRKKSIQATRYALVAFKDTLTTRVCLVDDLIGPKIKCVGATVKVTCNGLIQKGTIVTISESSESLEKQKEHFNVRKYFGLSTRTKSVQGTINVVKKETTLNKRSNSLAGPITARNVNKVNSTPISNRRSMCYDRLLPSPIINSKDPYAFPDTPSQVSYTNKHSIAKSSKMTTTGSSARQRLITDYFPFITGISPSFSDNTLNIEDAMDSLEVTTLSDVFEEDHHDKSIILVNNLDNLFDMIPESLVSKHLREELDDEIHTSNSTASSYSTHNHGICFARDVILNNAKHNADVMKYLDLQQKNATDPQDSETVIAPTVKTITTIPSTDASKLSVLQAATPQTPDSNGQPSNYSSPSKSPRLPVSTQDIYGELTPMELFHSLMQKCNNSKLDVKFITEDVLQDIKRQSKTPEIFARNLMYRLFTIEELKGCNVYGKGYTNGIRNGHLNPDVVRTIQHLTYRMFTFVKFSWQNCVRWLNKSIKYVTSLITEITPISDSVHLQDAPPLLSSTVIQYTDIFLPHSTIDVSLIELDSSDELTEDSAHTVPKSITIRRESSVYIPLKTSPPESWEDSLLQLSSMAIQPVTESSMKNITPQLLRTIQPIRETWEDSLLQLTMKNLSPESWNQSLLRTIKPTTESREDSLLQLSMKNLSPEALNQSLLRTIKPTTESWEDSLLQLSMKNLSPESWSQSFMRTIQPTTESCEDSLLQLSMRNLSLESWNQSFLRTIQPTTESWEDSLLSMKNLSPESWNQSLLRTIKPTTESREDSLLQLSMKNLSPESWSQSLLRTIQPTTETWEDSLLQLSMKNFSPESWNQSFMRTIQPTTESWEDSLLQLSMKNLSPESWNQSLLRTIQTTTESWEDSLLQLSMNNLSPESWNQSLLRTIQPTTESWEDSLLQLSMNNFSPVSWSQTLLETIQPTIESWEDTLLELSMKNLTLESWNQSLLRTIQPRTESWEDSLLQLSMKNLSPESLNQSLLRTIQPTTESCEDSLLQLSMRNLSLESWNQSFLRTIQPTTESWEDSLLSMKNLSPESWNQSLLRTFQPTTESWEDSLLELSMKNLTLESWNQSLLRTIQPTSESWEDSLLQLSMKNVTSEAWLHSLINSVQQTIQSWEDSLLHLSIDTSIAADHSLLKKIQPIQEPCEDSLLQLSVLTSTSTLESG